MNSNQGQTSLQVVFLIDITGSMGSQIEGVKQMVAKFCEVDRPSIDVHIWTFTESPGCHVTQSPVGLKSAELVEYTKAIILSQPPGKPGISAGGGDGPENVTAGIASLVEFFDVNQNLLCFIITDAPPHNKCFGKSTEAVEEEKWLEEAGFEDTDVFIVLCQVIDSLNLTFVPVLYGDAINKVWFHQAAAMTEGLVLCPKAASSEVLASGLGVLLDTFQKLSVSRDLSLIKSINSEELTKGFNILDINPEEFQMLEEDPSETNKINQTYKFVGGGEGLAEKIAAPFKTALDRFSGKKAATRCRDVSGEHIAASIRVLFRGMLFFANSELFDKEVFQANLEELKATLQALSEKDSKYKWEESVLQKFSSVIEVKDADFQLNLKGPDGSFIAEFNLFEKISTDLITLNQKPYSELDVSNWVDQVLQLLKCVYLNINYPKSASGRSSDFSDAWSASISTIEYSSIDSASFALKTKDPKEITYTSSGTSMKFNSLLILTQRKDLFLSKFYYFLTFFPTLQGLIQSHLISSTYKVFPSITLGLQASSLWFILRAKTAGPEFSEGEWNFITDIAHTIKTSLLKPAAHVYKACKSGKALNPVDNSGKIYSGILAYYLKNKLDVEKSRIILRLFFEEYSVENILYLIKSNSDILPTKEEMIKIFIDSKDIDEFDPLNGIHPIERLCRSDESIGEEYINKVKKLVFESKALKETISVFRVACGLLTCDLGGSNMNEAYRSEDLISDELLAEIFFESFILKKRTSRYVFEEPSLQWNRPSLDRIPSATIEKYYKDLVATSISHKLNDWYEKRRIACHSNLIQIVLSLPEGTFEDLNNKLRDVSYTVQGYTLKLYRSNVPEYLNKILLESPNNEQKLSTLGLALVIGDWTPTPSAEIRRYSSQILQIFGFSLEISKQIRLSLSKSNDCMRPVILPNRHGHYKENKYPGPIGWSSEYEENVRKTKIKPKKAKKLNLHLKELQSYTEYYNEVVKSILENEAVGEHMKNLVSWCVIQNQDVRLLKKVRENVERIMKAKIVDSEKIKWDLEIKELFRKIGKGKKAWERLGNFLSKVEKEGVLITE